MALNGVRSSWLIDERKSLFAALAASAMRCASRSCSISSRWRTSDARSGLRAFALGDVADRRQDERFIRRVQDAEAHLDGDLAAVRGEPDEVHAGAHRPRLRLSQELLRVPGVHAAEALR
jgi:hypothetical protein